MPVRPPRFFGVGIVPRFLHRRRLEHSVARAELALAKLRRKIAEKESTIAGLQAEVDLERRRPTRI